jgi:hypothetical protein
MMHELAPGRNLPRVGILAYNLPKPWKSWLFEPVMSVKENFLVAKI